MNIQQMMKRAQQMQDKLQEQAAQTRVEATAGGGMVTVVMNGLKQVEKLTIEGATSVFGNSAVVHEFVHGAPVQCAQTQDRPYRTSAFAFLHL